MRKRSISTRVAVETRVHPDGLSKLTENRKEDENLHDRVPRRVVACRHTEYVAPVLLDAVSTHWVEYEH